MRIVLHMTIHTTSIDRALDKGVSTDSHIGLSG